MSVLDNIQNKILNSKSILILGHENPDGDSIGSNLALHSALKKININSTVYIPVPDPVYSYLPGYNEIVTGENNLNAKDFDLAIVLDCSDITRLGSTKELFDQIDNSICIDHHITNQNFADISYVNAVASSTCENLIVIFASMGIAVNKEIATSLYTGIITDTGGFRYNVSTETMNFCSMLLETGIEYQKIYRRLFDVTSIGKTKLIARCLDRLELLEDGKIAFSYTTLKDLEELGIEESETEGLVNFGRNIDTVEVSILAKEKDTNSYKISMRANEYVDISLVATKFAGGGHLRASGCNILLPLESVKTSLVEEIKKQLK